jgi:glycosyltransferase involved in cell wall biosynthesis
MMLKCFDHQTYPKDRIEWIIVDDGTDKIEELVRHIPQVKYFKYDIKMTLGEKRNLLNDKSTGDILVYMDDDDYYPPERISHAVQMLTNTPKALCAGSSEMNIYFKHIHKMIRFGPYGPNHATAATFAFKRELLSITRFDEKSSVAEEKKFLKDYTIPFVQLDPVKSILVFSHVQNSFDKKELLNQGPNPTIHETTLQPEDVIKEKDILKFFMEDIDALLASYTLGKPEHKPDVSKQLIEIKAARQKMIEEHNKKQLEQHKQNTTQNYIDNLIQENAKLKDQIKYLESKIQEIINQRIQEKRSEILPLS